MFTVPNLITLANLFCGSVGVVFVMQERPVEAAIMVFLAAILDTLDGAVARLLNQSSPLGKDLDSLADVISFGLLPGLILLTGIQDLLLADAYNAATVSYSRAEAMKSKEQIIKYFGLLLPIFGALRLARFNNDPTQSKTFKGIPIPMAGMLVACIPFMIFAFSIDVTDTKNLDAVTEFSQLKLKDHYYQKVEIQGVETPQYISGIIEKITDTSVVFAQGVKKYSYPINEVKGLILDGAVFKKGISWFDGYFYRPRILAIFALLIGILMISNVQILSLKSLPKKTWGIAFFAGWAVVLGFFAVKAFALLPDFSGENDSILLNVFLHKPIVALLVALPFGLVFHLLFSIVYSIFNSKNHEVQG